MKALRPWHSLVVTASLWGALAVPLTAQCPDGTPPPCHGARVAIVAPQSVAVLAFEAPDTALAYRADGIADDITALLGRLPRLVVKSSRMARRAQASAHGDLRAVGRALGVRWVVDGSMRPVRGGLHIAAQLVDTRTGALAWGDTFDRAEEALLELPAVIAAEVASRVGGSAVTHAERATLTTLRTRSPEADQHFLRGNFFLAERSSASLARAVGEYLEAARIDSTFTAALGRAAYAQVLEALWGFGLLAQQDSLMATALELADRAVRLDSASSDGWMGRAVALAYWDITRLSLAREAYTRALALDPRNAEAHHQYAQLLNDLGDHDEAERQLRLALAIEPGRVISMLDIVGESRPRDPSAGLPLVDSAVALAPAQWVVHAFRALVRLRVGDVPGALDDARFAVRLDSNTQTTAMLALALARSGDSTAAQALVAARSRGPLPIYSTGAAAALLALGDTAEALDELERMPLHPGRWGRLRFPEFDVLRGNPRFERLLAESRPRGAMGL